MEPSKPEDAREIKYSKNARCIYYDFMIDAGKHISDKDYYVLSNDRTKEVISCAQTSRHFRPENSEFSGLTTFIEEISENPKYEKGSLPLLAHIALNTYDTSDETVTASGYATAIDSLTDSCFMQTKTGDWVLPKDAYKPLVKQVMCNSSLEYIDETNLNAVG